MTWKQVGYFSKQRSFWHREACLSPVPYEKDAVNPQSLEEVCSVSVCIAEGPPGWRELGKHNFYDQYDSPELAWSVVPAESRADYAIYAYRLYLMQYEDGLEAPIDDSWELAVVPMADSFVRLGYDAVVGGNGHSFGCSPLSCNHQIVAEGIPPINCFCLVDSAEVAIELARRFSISQPEPGPYCVVEVWRDTTTIAKSSVAPNLVNLETA